MPICEKCGNEINSDEKFCGKCGALVVRDETSNNTEDNKNEQNLSADIFILEQKYRLIKFKKAMAILMIISTSVAIIVGLIAAYSMASDLSSIDFGAERASSEASSISKISSVGGKTLEEAYYKDFGKYLGSYAYCLSHTAAIQYKAACILSGLYQTILWISLIIWIYILKKSLIQKKIFETTGRIE